METARIHDMGRQTASDERPYVLVRVVSLAAFVPPCHPDDEKTSAILCLTRIAQKAGPDKSLYGRISVGSASEHTCEPLGFAPGKVKIMTTTETPPVRRKIIGNRLRELREASGMSVEEVAKLMGVSRAAAYRQETGHTSVSVADAEKYMRTYGVEDTPIAEHIINLVVGDKNGRQKKIPKNIRDMGSQIEVAELEDIADRFLHYEPSMISGLIQSPEYISALFSPRYVGATWSTEDINRGITLRRARQEILYRDERPEMVFILSESALRYHVGDIGVMRSQAAHMVNLIRNHRIDVRIIPFTSGYVVGMSKPTILAEIGRKNPVRVAYYDMIRYGQLVEDDATISLTMEKFRMLMEVSLSPEKTADLLENYYE